jgi:predicted phage terminase large subunit-like protein
MSWFQPRFISVENVTINKNQTQFIKELKEKLIEHQINTPVYLYEPRTNKLARIKDNLEPIMSMQWIKFSKNISDKNIIPKLERQLLEYPNSDHDDIMDTLSQAIEVFRKKWIWESKEPPRISNQYSSITGKPIIVSSSQYQRKRPQWYRALWNT